MNHKKIKLISFIIACSTLCTSCGLKFGDDKEETKKTYDFDKLTVSAPVIEPVITTTATPEFTVPVTTEEPVETTTKEPTTTKTPITTPIINEETEIVEQTTTKPVPSVSLPRPTERPRTSNTPETETPVTTTKKEPETETPVTTEKEPETTVPTITTEIIETIPEAPVVEPSNDNVIISATTNVNIRTSNSTNALKIGSFKLNDTAYRILSCDNNWDLIRYNDLIGYVCRDYVEYHSDAEKDPYEHELLNDIVLTNTDLNFRKGPNTSYEKLDKLAENTELQVIAKTNNDWYLVNYNGTLGYVSSAYTTSLLEKAKSEYPELDLNEIDIQKVVYSTTSKLNIRNGNSTEHDIIGDLSKYETVRVLKDLDEWYFVLTNDYNFGFVNKGYTGDLTDKFVVVDLSEQQLFLYNNNELYLTTPVTTGKDSTPSDIGSFQIYSKQTGRYLTGPGYKSWVDYWMPYNGGEGLHDASWRSVFGTDSYHTSGSHGCINIPPTIADDVYNNVEVGTKVLVHK